ncbi:phospholipase A1-like [Drosophila nasuta]|uniref:phospholipase A1-like n=1 Tax=Drosophila nasuta TaxID=42062 RepID=UPI00295E94B4|nr:phospholipase A1-like [Drosophila nasuta]
MKLLSAVLLLLFAAVGFPSGEAIIGPHRCIVVKNHNCPNQNVKFWLYSKTTRDAPVKLDPLKLNPKDFNPPRPLKILLHGFTGNSDSAPNNYIRPALLNNEDVYVISVDYARLVNAPCYITSIRNLPLVSKCLAQLINNLVKQRLVQHDQIHIIGFSLGAHVAGQTANHVQRKLTRITGLDPAKPFINGNSYKRLDISDADFVDVIHTDRILGLGEPVGHVDFYPNYGSHQPGCRKENPLTPQVCNHDRAPRYYGESINSTLGFWGSRCTRKEYVKRRCPKNSPQVLMGYHASKKLEGSFFPVTDSKAPFALGKNKQADSTTNDENFDSEFDLESMPTEFKDDYEICPELDSNEIIEEQN